MKTILAIQNFSVRIWQQKGTKNIDRNSSFFKNYDENKKTSQKWCLKLERQSHFGVLFNFGQKCEQFLAHFAREFA